MTKATMLIVISLIILVLPLPAIAVSSGLFSDNIPRAKAQTQTIQQKIIIPYLSSGYKFMIVPHGKGTGFELPNVDESTFSIGNAAFGSYGYCPLNNQQYVRTNWPLDTDLLLRKSFNLPAGATNLKVSVAIDNDIQVFVNGHDISGGVIRHDYCAQQDSFVFTAPDQILNKGGSNLLAVRAIDRNAPIDMDYADAQVTASITSELDIKARRLQGHEGLPIYHLFLVYTDSTGQQYLFRGGPENTNPPYGTILGTDGLYDDKSVDWYPNALSKTLAKGTPDTVMNCFKSELVRITNEHVKYKLMGPNSNTVAKTLLDHCGFPAEKPDVYAPGWADPDL